MQLNLHGLPLPCLHTAKTGGGNDTDLPMREHSQWWRKKIESPKVGAGKVSDAILVAKCMDSTSSLNILCKTQALSPRGKGRG